MPRLLVLCCLVAALRAGETVTVFAAASLGGVLDGIAAAYEARTGVHVATSFAASSALAKQIANGAPAELVLSADEGWMDWLAERKLIDPASRSDLLANALVIVAPADKPIVLKVERDFAADKAFPGRMALADPASVPAGIYAKEAFTRLGWWTWLEPRVAPGSDVRAALRLVETGEADCGVVYATDAKASARVVVVATVPAELHRPIRYPLAATPAAGPAARAFLAFLRGPEAGAAFARAGFTAPR